MARAEAQALVRSLGGQPENSVTRRTSILVVGQEGWPLQKDGQLTRKLQMAKKAAVLGHRVAVVGELDWLDDLGLGDQANHIRRRFTLGQLGTLLKIPRSRLQAWMRAGLVAPVESVQGVKYFAYQQVANLRSLWEMTQSGVTIADLRHSLHRLAKWFPSVSSACPSASLLEQQGQILVRLDNGTLAEPSGQLQLDFGDDHEAVAAQSPKDLSAAEWLKRGCACEESGNLDDAARAYRQALFAGGPQADACFNLGNVLYNLGQLGQAAERYRQALELDHAFAAAWNNLGNVLAELGEHDEAIAAFEQALQTCPDYADAHYGLADTLQTVNRFLDARPHWKEYLRLEPMGEWAVYARRCLRVGG
ncbi:MAG: tetratricopeptide repeat protein [Gemmataceae bacterium]|nr:tetratricopeptide repeat protein [Gemmataceae bacterium]